MLTRNIIKVVKGDFSDFDHDTFVCDRLLISKMSAYRTDRKGTVPLITASCCGAEQRHLRMQNTSNLDGDWLQLRQGSIPDSHEQKCEAAVTQAQSWTVREYTNITWSGKSLLICHHLT